ncbi:MAG: ABC transporter substrate-binding protein [Bacteroidales bacterium]
MDFKRILLPTLLLLLSCTGGEKNRQIEYRAIENEYATRFHIAIDTIDRVTILELGSRLEGESQLKKFRLTNTPISGNREEGEVTIEVPPKKIVAMSTTYLPFISLLGESDRVCAISGSKYVVDTTIRRGIKNGTIVDIGYESSLNIELIISLDPDLILTYGIEGENNQYIAKLKSTGIATMAVEEYMEQHPLGKLEYLKFFGALFGKESYADSLYTQIRDSYLSQKSKVEGGLTPPVVLLNAPWRGVWYIPGGNSYMAHLIRDAGGEPLLSKKGSNYTQNLSVEEVLLKGEGVSYWLQPNQFETLEQLRKSDPLFENLTLIGAGRVYNNNKERGEGGGSAFWERGVVEPHIILKELIEILHSNGKIKEELVYYKPLK